MDLLKETCMINCKPIDTPMDPNHKLYSRTTEAEVDQTRYQKLVGKLIYLAHTRLDIGFTVIMVSCFMNNPSKTHMEAVMRILSYLKSASGLGLLFRKSHRRGLEVFKDANWDGSQVDRKSTSSMCTFVWGNLVLGGARSKPSLLEVVQKQNSDLLRMVYVRDYGFVDFR
ncbi:uncharacterized protein LOC106780389 [Vigna radiata var. radiata]|uniref:Uncharacterized protein LOC106780389 n=1 Tax=Vigna radiata var. radiata TaxID=3916 RepID=A0A1S3W0G6_VIGRR|nr:uncharacterized protein LOC106780389 [Vigna radiata var. radiata]